MKLFNSTTQPRGLFAFALVAMLALWGCQDSSAPNTAAATATEAKLFDVEKQREWAARLRSEGLDDQALRVYESLLADGQGLSENAFVGASLIVAEIHAEKGRHEDALASLIRSSAFSPAGEVGRKIDRLKMTCLERLGRSAAADRLLDRAVDPNAGGATNSQSAVVVAKVGADAITLAEFEGLLAQQPPELAEKLTEKSARLEVLRNLVAHRVMERKAKKLGLNDDPKVRLAMDLAERDILVRKLVADEVRERVEVKPDDVRLYYQANAARFREPSRFVVAQILADDLEHEARIRSALESEDFASVAARESRDQKTAKNGGKVEAEVIIGKTHPIFGDTRRLYEVLATVQIDQVAGESFKTTRGRHILRVLERVDGAPIPFEEVADQAGRMLRSEREQQELQRMMVEALDEADVQVFEDKIDG